MDYQSLGHLSIMMRMFSWKNELQNGWRWIYIAVLKHRPTANSFKMNLIGEKLRCPRRGCWALEIQIKLKKTFIKRGTTFLWHRSREENSASYSAKNGSLVYWHYRFSGVHIRNVKFGIHCNADEWRLKIFLKESWKGYFFFIGMCKCLLFTLHLKKNYNGMWKIFLKIHFIEKSC